MQLVDDLQGRGQQARHIPDIDAIVTRSCASTPGDVVVLMSNGGFGGFTEIDQSVE